MLALRGQRCCAVFVSPGILSAVNRANILAEIMSFFSASSCKLRVILVSISFIMTFTAVQLEKRCPSYISIENAVFWDVTPLGSCKNRHFGGMQRRENLESYKYIPTVYERVWHAVA
jgi:hypothetical protein